MLIFFFFFFLVFVSALQEEGDTAQSADRNTRSVLIYLHAVKSAKTMIAYFEPVATRERPVSEGGARENPSLSPQQRSNGTLPLLLLLLLLLQQNPPNLRAFTPLHVQPHHKHGGWTHEQSRGDTNNTPASPPKKKSNKERREEKQRGAQVAFTAPLHKKHCAKHNKQQTQQ